MFVPTLDLSAAESCSSALGVRLVASVCLIGYSRTSTCGCLGFFFVLFSQLCVYSGPQFRSFILLSEGPLPFASPYITMGGSCR